MGSKRLWVAQHRSPIIHDQYVEAVDIEDVLRVLREHNQEKAKRDLDATGEEWGQEDVDLYLADLEPTSVSLVAPEVIRG